MRADARIGRSKDPADTVARVAAAKRDVLLRVYRRRLPSHEDLEDCYSQATLELLARARRGTGFESPLHVLHALEQKFASRINDRHRATGGRSATETALAGAVSLSDQDGQAVEVSDGAPSVADKVLVRQELRRLREIAEELTPDQRLVLFCQVTLGMDSASFCAKYGWSSEKYRKVAQRARAKLRTLTRDYDEGQRCRQLSQDLLAYAARAADDPQRERVRVHLEHCAACAMRVRELDRAARQIGALLPVPVAAKTGLLALAVGAVRATRHHVVVIIRGRPPVGRPHSLTTGAGAVGGSGAVGGAGGSLLGAGAAKLGVTALCLAGAAGSFAVCRQAGWIAWSSGGVEHARTHFRTHPKHWRSRQGRGARTPSAVAQTTVAAERATPPRSHPAVDRSPSAAARERRRLNVQREFGLDGGGRGSVRRLRRMRSRRRAARAGLASSGAAPSGAGGGVRAARRLSGRGGDFPGAGRASRGTARREFGF